MINEFGMDYGVRPRMMLISDWSFTEAYHKGKCWGLSYMFCPDTKGALIPVELGLCFKIEKYADEFMEALLRWVKDSDNDGDALDLEFIECNDGQLILGMGPNIDLFVKRMIPEILRDRVDPIFTIGTQGKGGLTTGENYQRFKQQYQEGRKIVFRAYIGNDANDLKIGNPYLVKSSFRFSKENELPPDSMGIGLLGAKKNTKFNPKDFKRKEPVDMQPVVAKRMEQLHYFFPLVMDKIEKENWLKEVIAKIPPHISAEEVYQSICNLVLFERLKQDNPSGIKSSGPGGDMRLLQHLLETVESFDSYFPPETFFTKSNIQKQAKLDKQYLKSYLEKI